MVEHTNEATAAMKSFENLTKEIDRIMEFEAVKRAFVAYFENFKPAMESLQAGSSEKADAMLEKMEEELVSGGKNEITAELTRVDKLAEFKKLLEAVLKTNDGKKWFKNYTKRLMQPKN